MELKLIGHGSPEYNEMVELRMELLRRPLGLSFTEDQLADETDDLLVCAFENGQLIGCCVLTQYKTDIMQLRQMAVRHDIQSRGVGRKIVAFAERLTKQNGYRVLMMHARNTALDFYKKCGYKLKGNEFIEVGIPHHYMEKRVG